MLEVTRVRDLRSKEEYLEVGEAILHSQVNMMRQWMEWLQIHLLYRVQVDWQMILKQFNTERVRNKTSNSFSANMISMHWNNTNRKPFWHTCFRWWGYHWGCNHDNWHHRCLNHWHICCFMENRNSEEKFTPYYRLQICKIQTCKNKQ